MDDEREREVGDGGVREGEVMAGGEGSRRLTIGRKENGGAKRKHLKAASKMRSLY